MTEIEGVPARSPELSPAKLALLRKWASSREEKPAPQRIPRRGKDGPAPLSFTQLRLWFLDQLVPGSAAYNIPSAVRLDGELDAALLARCLDETVRRHESLRSRFLSADGVPFQVAEPFAPRLFPLVDVSALPEPVREAEVERLTAQDAVRPFDLVHGPVLRATLLRLSPSAHIALLTMHHIVSDGWSCMLFFKELAALYQAFADGRPSPLPELPIQYADFAAWQRDRLRGEVLERQLAYWRSRLAGSEPLELPTDRPRPAVQSFRGSTLRFALDTELSEALVALAQREGASPFMVLLAAFKVLLARCSRQEDLCVGFPVANRERLETETLIGFFANTLVLRSEVAGGATFLQLLARLRAVAFEAYEHQDLPFEKLVDEISPERDMSRNPLFQVMFTFQKGQQTQIDLPRLSLSQVSAERSTAMFDLWLSMQLLRSGLLCQMEYNSDLFDRSSAERLVFHLHNLLRAVAADPGRRIDQIPLLDEGSRHQLLAEWNDTARGYPRHQELRRLHDLLDAQALRTPDATAVVFEGERLTYRELHARAGRLAARLRALGAAPGEPIGACLERSLEMVVSLVAILKAGGAYLPLDPTLPRERLALLVEDARLSLVVTTAAFAPLLPDGARAVLAEDDPSGAAEPPPLDTAEDGLAYVIYTSGSTGRPKGVMVPHRGILNRLLWMQERYGLDATDRVLQKTPFTFDVSVWEFFWPLLTGATLVVARPEGHKDPGYLVDQIERARITTVHFVPSMLAAFLEAPGLERCASLRRVVCSGEALPIELAHRFHARLGGELHNLYGPTEASVDVTSWACRPADDHRAVPIGRPIANIDVLVLDPAGGPAPVGIPGELHIGGVGLARGYLGRPDLTAASFVPHPFSDRSGERLYRTGDLVKALPDGAIQFLGRIDHQVKVRGFRIELGEVEAILAEHPSVLAATVVVREDTPGERRLCGYVVPDPRLAWEEAAGGEAPLAGERVAEWRQVFDEAYRAGADAGDPAFNIAGWNSTYTGEPIPPEEMRVWVESTADRILALRPRRVLEIGCGTGLLLFRVAPYCDRYVGRDVSPEAIAYLEHHLASRPLSGVSGVDIACAAADDFAGIAAQAFDAVVINSVAQYFPRVDYLLQVLEGAVRAVAPGGAVFLGDVRCLPLLEAFHGAVELHQAPDDMAAGHLLARLKRRAAQDGELVFAPDLFAALPRKLPRIGRVEVQLKRGRYHNELSRFRYDVVLHVGPAGEPEASELSWPDEGLGLADLRQLLGSAEAPAALRVTGIPNARLAAETRLLALLADPAGPTRPGTAGELRRALADTPAGIEPEDLWQLGKELGYEVEVRWGRPPQAGTVDATFRAIIRRPGAPLAAAPAAAPAALPDWSRFANDPLSEKIAARLVPELRELLKRRLPDYMIPQAFVVLASMPLSTSGKVDRGELPAPPPVLPDLEKGFTRPRTPEERLLAEIWAQVLNLPEVGIHNNFFELGGNSIHSIQVVSRAQRAGLRLTPRQLFQHQTIADLAVVAERVEEEASPAAPVELGAAQRWLLREPPGARPWNRCLVLHAEGPIDPAALSGALAEAAADPALRSALRWESGSWRWTEPEAPRPLLTRIDLSALPEAGPAASAATSAAESLRSGLDLSAGPLLRAALLERGPGRNGSVVLLAHGLAAGAERFAALADRIGAGWRREIRTEPVLDFPWTGLESRDIERLLASSEGIEDLYPASPLQAHMYHRHHAAPVPGLFVVQRGFPLPVRLDLGTLGRALQTVVDRHPFLRSSLAALDDGRVFQLVHRGVQVDFEGMDWRDLDRAEQDRRIEEHGRASRQLGFDPAVPRPLRLFVAQVEDHLFHVHVTTHYMRLDGWSLNVVISEVLALCQASLEGREIELPRLRLYTDFLEWRRRQDLSPAADYWRQTLRGLDSATPIVREEPAGEPEESEIFTRQHVYLDETATAALDELCRSRRLTLNTVVQGAWSLVLSAASGRDDLVFGVMVAGRPAEIEGVETLVGPMVNVLPLRVRVPADTAADTALVPWLAALQEQQSELRQFEYGSPDEIRRWTGWPAGEPLFESYLAFQNLPEFTATRGQGKAAGSSGNPAESYLAQMEHPLRIDAFPGPALGLVLSYYPGKVPSRRVAWMLRALASTLRAMAADPEATLGTLRPAN